MVLYDAMDECLKAKYTTVDNAGDFAIQREGETLKIFFEWSDGREDWRNNFRFLAIPCKPYKNMPLVWFCHRGFLKVWKSIEPHLKSHIMNLDVRDIEIVGYSHGAAIALLCFEYCTYHRPDIEVTGVGFGAPRVFWGIVPREVKKRMAGFRVVRNGGDLVTHLPPRIFGYRQLGRLEKVGSKKGPIKDHYPTEYSENLGK